MLIIKYRGKTSSVVIKIPVMVLVAILVILP